MLIQGYHNTPDEVEDLEIEKGKDVTLDTCTPYGATRHRLRERSAIFKYTKTQNVERCYRMVMLKYIAILAVGVNSDSFTRLCAMKKKEGIK